MHMHMLITLKFYNYYITIVFSAIWLASFTSSSRVASPSLLFSPQPSKHSQQWQWRLHLQGFCSDARDFAIATTACSFHSFQQSHAGLLVWGASSSVRVAFPVRDTTIQVASNRIFSKLNLSQSHTTFYTSICSAQWSILTRMVWSYSFICSHCWKPCITSQEFQDFKEKSDFSQQANDSSTM